MPRPNPLSRRDALKHLGALGAGIALAPRAGARPTHDITINAQPAQIDVTSLSDVTVRITVRPLVDGKPLDVPPTGELADPGSGKHIARWSDNADAHVRSGNVAVRYSHAPPTIQVESKSGEPIQSLVFDPAGAAMTFALGDGPILGLGEGGPQFDRRGTTDRMVRGQGGYKLATNGTRAPIQWMIITGSHALFVHQPYGAFDFSGARGVFTPRGDAPTPVDVFVVASKDPRVVMREYARITGFPEMPPLWGFGYQQSHRTLAGRDEILGEARTFREKKLPCDLLIYLGTEFAPSGWNTRNGEFTWHPTNFPDPKAMLAELHGEHFRVAVHTVIEGHKLLGTVKDPCTAPPLPSGRTPDNRWPPERQVSCYWPYHKSVMDDGVDGFWPDQGDGYDGPSELNRHRMYWEGPQLYRPDQRPFALHRNASAGVQRFGSFVWSGDVSSRWETLKTHVPVGVNAALSGLPYWGTDIGGFNPTAEFDAELYLRWFQFAAFNPLFRAHGRNWHLRLPWGWNGGDGGPPETARFSIDPSALHDERVEPICRKYLELRYQLMPYLQTALRDVHDTGTPIMRALWLQYPDDAAAVQRADEYLWGPDMLVAPVVEKGATSRRVYLPRGQWIDWWTEETVDGGKEIERPVDLATTPIYVRAGAVIPVGPVKQYVAEHVDAPLTLTVFPGADGDSTWYEDDGVSFGFRRGEWMRVNSHWSNAQRRLSLRLAPGARRSVLGARKLEARVAGTKTAHAITFTGAPLEVSL